MAMHACQIGPLTPHPLARDRHYGPVSGQRGERFGAGNLSAPISPLLLKCVDGATTLSLRFGIDQDLRISGLYGKLAADVSKVDQPGSSSASIAGLLTAKTGGMARSGIGCWVAVAMSRPCRSRTISILRRIVRATKAATWSHPSALFSIIGTKLSSVRGDSPIFSRVVIASSLYSRNAGHSNRVCQASSSRLLLSQLEHSGLSTSFMLNR